jgi:hypothetical protein
MNEATENMLAEKVKSCFSGKTLPDSFKEDLIASCRSRVRKMRLKICGAVLILLIVLGWAIVPCRTVKSAGNTEARLISASEPKPVQEITGLVILGILRDCILTRRNNKKKEENCNDN